ncbi:MAG: hypothetical protein M3R02_18815 [Chloroflexota bacterium]|nr:hypothetical protein [Chloroflexota bacterium]
MSFASFARRYALPLAVISVMVAVSSAPAPLLAEQTDATPTGPVPQIGATATPRLQIGPTPTPTAVAGVIGSTYTGRRHDWALVWDDKWAVQEEASGNAGDRLVLTSGTTTVSFESRDGVNRPDECLVALTGRHVGSDASGTPTPAADPQGNPLAGAEGDRAWAVYVVGTDAVYVECRVWGNMALHVVAQAPLDAFNTEAASILALLDGILGPIGTATSSPIAASSATVEPTPTTGASRSTATPSPRPPTVAPTPTPRPTATSQPFPTPDEAEDVARAEATAIACLERYENQTGCPVLAFEEAYERHPRSDRLREDLYLALVLNGRQYETLGSLDEARQNYERAYDLIPSRPEAIAALDRVRPYAESLFAERFDSTLGFSTTSDANSDSYYDDGALGLRVKRAGYYFYYLLRDIEVEGGVEGGDYAVVYDAQVTAGTYGSFDIYLGATSSMAYRFRLYPMSGNWVWEQVDLVGGQATLIDSGFGARSNYFQGTPDRIEARVESGTATFLVNGTEVGASRLTRTGQVGFGVTMPDDSYDLHFAVAFDNVAVYRLGTSGGGIASLGALRKDQSPAPRSSSGIRIRAVVPPRGG